MKDQYIWVRYSDGSEGTYETIQEAQEGISETVLGCNFAATVDSVELVSRKTGKVVKTLYCQWQVTLLTQP
jgi:hypothetical protein